MNQLHSATIVTGSTLPAFKGEIGFRGGEGSEVKALLAGFDVHKAAHAVAFFALKGGGKINVLKASKLVYLAEREFMRLYDEPMLFDELVSMDHGPVPSVTLSLIDGNLEHDAWSQTIEDRSGHEIGVVAGLSLDGLDHLSPADVDVLQGLWDKFGTWDRFRLRDYTHQKCPEWEDPNGSSTPIPHERVFKFLEKGDLSSDLAAGIRERRLLARNIAQAN